jgi:hypothetical protein
MVIGPRFAIQDIEPPEVRRAPRPQRHAYWTAVAGFVVEAKDSELRRGLDRFGNPMAALSEYTIAHRTSAMGPADPNAPPLQPAHGLSRTRSLFTSEPNSSANGVVCWWAYDAVSGASWGKILAYHRDGNKHLPKRDVIGLAPESLAIVAKRAVAWWRAYELGLIEAAGERGKPAAPGPKPRPEPKPRFTVETVPAYQPKHPERAIPKNPSRVSQLKVNGHVYTLQTGSASQVRGAIARETFSGWHTAEQARANLKDAGVTRVAPNRYKFSFGTPRPPGTTPMPGVR